MREILSPEPFAFTTYTLVLLFLLPALLHPFAIEFFSVIALLFISTVGFFFSFGHTLKSFYSGSVSSMSFDSIQFYKLLYTIQLCVAASSYVNCPKTQVFSIRRLSIWKCTSNLRIILKSKTTTGYGREKNV